MKALRRLAHFAAAVSASQQKSTATCAATASRSVVNALPELPHVLRPLASFYEELECTGRLATSLEAVRWYADPAAANYRSLNRMLREGGAGAGGSTFAGNKSLLKQLGYMDELIRASPPLQSPGLTLWRGFASSSYAHYVLGEMANKPPHEPHGFLIEDRAFMSCSLLESVGNFYSRRHAVLPEDLDDAVLIRIHVQPGARVICVACCSGGVLGEQEILLPRGSVIRVERVAPRNSSTSVLFAEATLVVNETLANETGE